MPLSVLNGNFLLTQHSANRSLSIHIAVLSGPVNSQGKRRLIGAGCRAKVCVCVCVSVCLCVCVSVCVFAVDVEKNGKREAKQQ